MGSSSWTKEEIKKGKLRFMHVAKKMMPEFVIDERNKSVINDLFFYFHKIENGNLNTSKGLWIEGEVGTGKSSLMRIFSSYLRTHCNDSTFKIYNCATVANEYASKARTPDTGDDGLDCYTYNRNGYNREKRVPMCFDELGREPIPAVHFGQRLNVMEHILHIRYSFWQTENLLTYITTNLSAEDVELKYNDYIRDRRKEMFNIIALTGESRRI